MTDTSAPPPTELGPSPIQLSLSRLVSPPDHKQAVQSSEAPNDAFSSQTTPSAPADFTTVRATEDDFDGHARRESSGPATEAVRKDPEGESVEDSKDMKSDRITKAHSATSAEDDPGVTKSDRVSKAPPRTPEAAASDAAEAATPPAASRAPRLSVSVRDFTYGRLLGVGSFSKVVLATYRGDGKEYALKVMSKQHIMRERKVRGVKRERMILDQLDYPGVVRMHFTFQDQNSLYMAMECCHGGDLFDQIRIQGRLPKSAAQFYAAEMVCTLEYIHSRGVVHRDLKPENLLLTADGHLRLADFGSATLVPSSAPAHTLQPGVQLVQLPPEDCASDERNGSFVGTAEYISPEVLNSQPATPESDLWALGCIIFHMLEGRPPFHGASEYLTFQNVLKCDYKFSASDSSDTSDGAGARPNGADANGASLECDDKYSASDSADVSGGNDARLNGADASGASSSSEVSESASSAKCTGTEGTERKCTVAHVDQASRDLIGALLKLEPSERLGSVNKGGYGALKRHAFFAGVDWTSKLWGMEAPGLAEEEGSSRQGEGEDGESEEEESSEEEEVDEEWQVAHLGGSMLRLKC